MPYSVYALSVGTTPIEIAPNRRRTNLSIVNLSANAVYVVVSREQSAGEGFPISAGGGSLSFNRLFGSDPTARYFLVSTVAGCDVRVIEEFG